MIGDWDTEIGGLTARFTVVQENEKISEAEIKSACSKFTEKYSCDVTENELTEELLIMKQIHTANLGKKPLDPFDLLNKISELKLGKLLRNMVIALRIFALSPVTVASSERSFSKARNLDFHDIIEDFSKQKARKITL